MTRAPQPVRDPAPHAWPALLPVSRMQEVVGGEALIGLGGQPVVLNGPVRCSFPVEVFVVHVLVDAVVFDPVGDAGDVLVGEIKPPHRAAGFGGVILHHPHTADRQKLLAAHIKLPPAENFTVEYVTNKPWGGYNWYKGNYRSVIQVNTDLPIYVDRAIDLAAHEGYPGHHVYNALLEKNLRAARLVRRAAINSIRHVEVVFGARAGDAHQPFYFVVVRGQIVITKRPVFSETRL